jgi:hypothetical protein
LRFERPGQDGAAASLEEVLLRHALGEDVSGYRRERRVSAVMMIPIPARGILRDVRGVEDAGAIAGIDSVQITAKHDSLLIPLPEGRSYLGFIFAHGDDASDAEQALRTAHAKLCFVIDRDVPVI